MSFPPPLGRQGARINVTAGDGNTGADDSGPLAGYKDAMYLKPYPTEVVWGFNGHDFIKCKYDHIKRVWVDREEKNILEILMWKQVNK